MFPKMEGVELESERIATSPTLGWANPEPIPELLFMPYDPKTPLPDLVKFHTRELAQRAVGAVSESAASLQKPPQAG